MEDVSTLLNATSRHLLTTIADMMEDHQDDDFARIHLLHNAVETVTFPIDWNKFLYDIQGASYLTAFSRYQKLFGEQLCSK
jgi:hypothetical protein